MATKKNFIWFLSESINFLDNRAIEYALEDTLPSDKYGQEGGRYYILEDNEDEWRTKMKKLKERYEAYKLHKFLITFSSDEKSQKARQYLDSCMMTYEVDIKSNDIIVYCLDTKQKYVIRAIKEFVNSHIKRRVII